MPNQLLLGMLIGAGAAVLLYLVLSGRLTGRRSAPTDEDRAGTVKKRVRLRQLLAPQGVRSLVNLLSNAQAVLNQMSDAQNRPGDLPFVVEKRTAGKVTIHINGEVHEYNSLDEVPAEFRALIDKARRAGPSRITIEVNGKRYTYNSRDEVPTEFRHLLPPPAGDAESSGTGEAEGPDAPERSETPP